MHVRVSLALLASIGAAACNFSQAGLDPTPTTMNFPIAIELFQPDPAAADASHLFVVNSNFDLRFNTGSVQAIDLARVNDLLASECGGGGEDCVLDRLTFIDDNRADMHPVILDEVGLGSHADGLALRPSDQRRLYFPVRSTRDLTSIDFDPASGFTCDQSYRAEVEPGTARWDAADIPRCSDAHRVTRREAVANERELDLTGDPVAVAVVPSLDVGSTEVGDFLLMALRDGRVALFLDDGSGASPELLHIADGFPNNLVTLTMEPGTGVGWLTAVGTNEIARVGIVVDSGTPSRSFVYDGGRLRLGGIDDGQDSRDIQFHPQRPDTAFILSRRPESVIEVDLQRRGLTNMDFGLRAVFEVGRGPSRLVTTVIDGRTFVLASCFDAQRLFIIDAEVGALVAVVGGFSGPFETVIDPHANRLYMVDFSVSVIRVLDISPLASGGVPTLIGTLGNLTPVMSLTGN
ncbi:MAG: hypothetical protein H6719_01500 [Sandaracinaceae bacterium]|nr:hypothetical protein [Sandaracinaceae bacterium]